MRRKVALIVTIVFACSLLATDEDVSFAAQQDGGFFGRLFTDQPPPKRARKQRQGGGFNPFLGSPDQGFWGQQPGFQPWGQPWGQPLFKKPKPVQKAQPSEPPLPTVEVKAKDAKARKILVVGDFIAGGLAWGLDQEFADEPKLAVLDKSNAGSGLVRDDVYDWNKQLPAILNTEKPDLVIVLFGGNDRQPMRQANQRLPVGSDTWEKVYTQHVDGLIDTLKVYGRPFFWMSTPPMRAGTAGSGDVTYLNSLYKPRVEAAGGSFVDVWNGFTNANGQYISSGPDTEGQVRQLRTNDGINFTRAGRLKLAFYAEREVRRKTGLGGGTVDLMASANQQSQIEIGPDGKKRLVGPVISLSDPLPGASDTLAGGGASPALPVEQSAQFDMVVKGAALPSTPGRTDDFAWPPRPAGSAPPVAQVITPPVLAPAAEKPAKAISAPAAADDKPAVLTPVSKAN